MRWRRAIPDNEHEDPADDEFDDESLYYQRTWFGFFYDLFHSAAERLKANVFHSRWVAIFFRIGAIPYWIHDVVGGLWQRIWFNSFTDWFGTVLGLQLTRAAAALHSLIRAPFAWIRDKIQRLEQRLAESRWFAWIAYGLRGMRIAREMVVLFFQGWLFSRDYRQLVWGLPAMVLALPLFAAMALIPMTSPSAMTGRYRTALAEATAAQDRVKARLLYRKLEQLEAVNERLTFRQALNHAANGRLPAALELMQSLAPTDRPGYLPAHLWIVDHLMRQTSDVSDKGSTRLIETHLRLAQDSQPKNIRVKRYAARFHLMQGHADSAVTLLSPLAAKNYAARLDLAVSYREQGKTAESRREARWVVRSLVDDRRSGTQLSPLGYRNWARAYVILDRLDQALLAVSEGLKGHPDNKTLSTAFIDTLVMYTRERPRRATQTLLQRPALMKLALELAPTHPVILRQAAALSVQTGPTAQQCQEFLRPGIESGQLPANVLTFLAQDALRKEDYETARTLLLAARQVDVENLQAASGLAWIYVRADLDPVEDAFELANQAATSQPTNAMFRNVRGQVLAKLERWDAAVDDLEFALNAQPNRPVLHELLATAYDRLNMTDLAVAHAQAAESLRRRSKP